MHRLNLHRAAELQIHLRERLPHFSTLVHTGALLLSRITISLDDDQHRSLKLLCILEGKTLAQVLQEAIQQHLQSKGADQLAVTRRQPPNDPA